MCSVCADRRARSWLRASPRTRTSSGTMLTARPPVITPTLAVVSASRRPSRIAAMASAATRIALTPCSGAMPAWAARPRTTTSIRFAPGARVKARPTASLSNTRPRRARIRPRSRWRAPRSPTSSQTVNTTSSGGWPRRRSRHTRTHSQTIATPDLSSPPSTVVPSLRITSSSTTGRTPAPGSTVSMCAQRRSGGASTLPGTGAVGSVVGGLLAAAGSAVTLLGRRAHVDAVRARGLALDGLFGVHRVTGFECATAATELDDSFGAIFLTVKTYDADAMLDEVRPLLAGDGVLICMQNGLGTLERAIGALGRARVLGARVIFGAELPTPGRATVTVCADPVLIGALEPEVQARAVAWARVLSDAGIPAESTSGIVADLWAKVFYNAALNPLGALLDLPYGALAEDADARAVMDLAIDEAFAVARTAGIALRWPDAEAYRGEFYGRLVPATARHRSSMLQDLARGRPTEIDAINGYVAARGNALGVATPTNTTLTRLIRARARLSSSWKH